MTDNRTTELREKLTERGVEWKDVSNGFADVTVFVMNGIKWTVISKSYLNPENDWMKMNAERITPEQAIAVTLGSECHVETCEPNEEWCCNHCGADLVECDIGVSAGGGAYELDPPILVNYCPSCGRKVVD